MIRSGRREGWLTLPLSTFQPWVELNDIQLNGVKFANIKDCGAGLVATRSFGTSPKSSDADGDKAHVKDDDPSHQPEMLMKIPSDMVISKETVRRWASHDGKFKELLDACPELIEKKARGWILLFLLYQVTSCNPSVSFTCARNPFMEYIKFLPEVPLPTFWTPQEQDLLEGTSLRPALSAKLGSLRREFEKLHTGTANIAWCSEHWWNHSSPPGFDDFLATGSPVPEDRYWSGTALTFEDWLHLDAAYRSRALELPDIGDAMVPALDMANHASETETTARYDVNADGSVALMTREEKPIADGEEIFITYGDNKGACEMLFSYGFLESSMTSAREVFLDLAIPDDDPLKFAKKALATSAPGVRIFDAKNDASTGDETRGTEWESDYVWWSCVNEEDGLEFRILQQKSGERELVMIWDGTRLENPDDIGQHLKQHELRDVFELRAVVMIQERVEQQLMRLEGDWGSGADGADDANVRPQVKALIARLRELEGELLERAYDCLEQKKLELASSDSVQQYLQNQAQRVREAPPEEAETGAGQGYDDDTEDFS